MKPEGFKCEKFELEPFESDDYDPEDENKSSGECFYYGPKDVSVGWYKHPGRGMTGDYNKLTAKEVLQMGLDCFEAMGK